MRVAGNKVKHLQAFYFTELADQFEEGEIRAIFKTVVQHYLKFSATDVLLKAEENVNQSDLLKIYDTAKFLKEGRPLQYILQEAWFMNHVFYVDEAVLIPRPETEELVDLIMRENNDLNSVLDIGTGSGCIPISLQIEQPHANIIGCDVSDAALKVSARNSKKLATTVQFVKANALSADFAKQFSQKFEIIISNPPYIKQSEAPDMAAHVMAHEPHLALFVEGEDAIVFYRKIIDACKELLTKNGKLYFELNPITAEEVQAYALKSGLFAHVEVLNDLSGKKRFLKCY